MKKSNWRTYIFEFVSIFVAVVSAFALTNWNDNRKDQIAADKILTEIYQGLEKDLQDIHINSKGHLDGIEACKYWRRLGIGDTAHRDSVTMNYFNLTRDFVSIQNTSGYEVLKSKGLEIIQNDSLRTNIIALYEYSYKTLLKLEEQYHETQFQENYFIEWNRMIAPYILFDEKGNVAGVEQPFTLSKVDRNIYLSYLWKIQVNRNFMYGAYLDVEQKVEALQEQIQAELQ